MTRKDILDSALKCVNGDRDHQYGKPENNFQTIANLWNDYLFGAGILSYDIGRSITAKDVPAMMALMKLARVATGTGKADNWIDIAGYAACGGEVDTRESDDSNDGSESTLKNRLKGLDMFSAND